MRKKKKSINVFTLKDVGVKCIVESADAIYKCISSCSEIRFKPEGLSGFDSSYSAVGLMALNTIQVALSHEELKLAKRIVRYLERVVAKGKVNDFVYRSYVPLSYMERCALTMGIKYMKSINGCRKEVYRVTLASSIRILAALSPKLYDTLNYSKMTNNIIESLYPRVNKMIASKL